MNFIFSRDAGCLNVFEVERISWRESEEELKEILIRYV